MYGPLFDGPQPAAGAHPRHRDARRRRRGLLAQRPRDQPAVRRLPQRQARHRRRRRSRDDDDAEERGILEIIDATTTTRCARRRRRLHPRRERARRRPDADRGRAVRDRRTGRRRRRPHRRPRPPDHLRRVAGLRRLLRRRPAASRRPLRRRRVRLNDEPDSRSAASAATCPSARRSRSPSSTTPPACCRVPTGSAASTRSSASTTTSTSTLYEKSGSTRTTSPGCVAERDALIRSAVTLAGRSTRSPTATAVAPGRRDGAQQPARPHLPHRLRLRPPVLARGLGRGRRRRARLPAAGVRRRRHGEPIVNAPCGSGFADAEGTEPVEGDAELRQCDTRAVAESLGVDPDALPASPAARIEEHRHRAAQPRHRLRRHQRRRLRRLLRAPTSATRGWPTSRRSSPTATPTATACASEVPYQPLLPDAVKIRGQVATGQRDDRAAAGPPARQRRRRHRRPLDAVAVRYVFEVRRRRRPRRASTSRPACGSVTCRRTSSATSRRARTRSGGVPEGASIDADALLEQHGGRPTSSSASTDDDDRAARVRRARRTSEAHDPRLHRRRRPRPTPSSASASAAAAPTTTTTKASSRGDERRPRRRRTGRRAGAVGPVGLACSCRSPAGSAAGTTVAADAVEADEATSDRRVLGSRRRSRRRGRRPRLDPRAAATTTAATPPAADVDDDRPGLGAPTSELEQVVAEHPERRRHAAAPRRALPRATGELRQRPGPRRGGGRAGRRRSRTGPGPSRYLGWTTALLGDGGGRRGPARAEPGARPDGPRQPLLPRPGALRAARRPDRRHRTARAARWSWRSTTSSAPSSRACSPRCRCAAVGDDDRPPPPAVVDRWALVHLVAGPGLAEGLEVLVAALVVVDVADVLGLEPPVVRVQGGVAEVRELRLEERAGGGLGVAVELGDGPSTCRPRALPQSAGGSATAKAAVGFCLQVDRGLPSRRERRRTRPCPRWRRTSAPRARCHPTTPWRGRAVSASSGTRRPTPASGVPPWGLGQREWDRSSAQPAVVSDPGEGTEPATSRSNPRRRRSGPRRRQQDRAAGASGPASATTEPLDPSAARRRRSLDRRTPPSTSRP